MVILVIKRENSYFLHHPDSRITKINHVNRLYMKRRTQSIETYSKMLWKHLQIRLNNIIQKISDFSEFSRTQEKCVCMPKTNPMHACWAGLAIGVAIGAWVIYLSGTVFFDKIMDPFLVSWLASFEWEHGISGITTDVYAFLYFFTGIFVAMMQSQSSRRRSRLTNRKINNSRGCDHEPNVWEDWAPGLQNRLACLPDPRFIMLLKFGEPDMCCPGARSGGEG